MIWSLQRLPFRILRPTMRLIVGRCARLLQGKAARRHLALAYGDTMSAKERRWVVKKLGDNLGEYVAESLTILRHGFATFDGKIDDQEARAVLRAAQASCPRGMLGVAAHIGNWEMIALWVQEHWPKGVAGVIAKRTANPHLDKIVVDFRTQTGLPTIYMDDPPSKSLRALRRGEIIGILPDQDLRKLSGTFIDFFGRPTYTTIGPARLALAAKVPIFTGFCLRTETGFRIVMNEPIHPDLDRPREEEIERLTRAWSAEIEAIIRKHPEQWAWFHDRWRTTPAKLEAKGRVRM